MLQLSDADARETSVTASAAERGRFGMIHGNCACNTLALASMGRSEV